MSKDVSVAFKASDNLTKQVQDMRKGVNNLMRDVSSYRKVQDEAFNKKVEVKFEIEQAKRELKELGKAVKDNVSGSEQAFKDKQKSIELLSEEYRRLTKVAKEASKAENKLQEDISRTSNRNASRGGSQSVLETIGKIGIGNMVGESVQNLFTQSITSQFGQDVGGTVNSIFGGAVSGATYGAAAGLPGMAVGAVLGGISGGINAVSDYNEKRDDMFREDIKNLYSNAKESTQSTLDSGIQRAGNWEQNKISFGTLLKGDENADRFLEDVRQFGAVTPFESEDLLETSKKLLTYGYGQNDILPLMTKIGDAGSALGMSTEDMNWVATSIGRMRSTDKTTLEYLNPLMERGIPAMDYLAKSLGKSKKAVYEMVSDGLIPGAKAAEIIANSMGEQYFGNMEKQSHTYEGLVSTLSDAQAELERAMGEGYNEERKKGLEQEIETLNGPLAEQMKEANRLIGTFKADLENQHQQSLLDAVNDVMNNPENARNQEYMAAQASGDGATMGRLLEEAKVEAEIAYRGTEGYQLQQQADLLLVQNIQNDATINSAYYDYGRKMANQFSLGYQSGWLQRMSGIVAPSNGGGLVGGSLEQAGVKGYATGLDRVPYNNMPALLHEGERVLTKVEADKQDKGASVTPQISITVHNESGNAYEITREICNQIIKASENFVGGV